MHQSLHQKKGSLSLQDNERIVALIKAKISPVHKKVLRFAHVKMHVTAPNFYKRKRKQYSIIDEKQLDTFELLKNQSSIQLVQKAKRYIEQKKKSLKDLEFTPKNIDLSMYIQLFDGKNNKENQHMQQFLKMKRESMHMMSFYEQKSKVQASEQAKTEPKTEQEYSLINAKIRRKLNHKKIIELYKYS